MISFTPRPLCTPGKNPPPPLDGKLGRPQSLSEWYGEKCLSSVGNRTPIPLSFGPQPSHSTDVAPTSSKTKLYFLQSYILPLKNNKMLKSIIELRIIFPNYGRDVYLTLLLFARQVQGSNIIPVKLFWYFRRFTQSWSQIVDTVACRSVARRRPQNRQLYSSRC
jgi:hypothetical protein